MKHTSFFNGGINPSNRKGENEMYEKKTSKIENMKPVKHRLLSVCVIVHETPSVKNVGNHLTVTTGHSASKTTYCAVDPKRNFPTFDFRVTPIMISSILFSLAN